MNDVNGKGTVRGQSRRSSRCIVASRWLCLAGGMLGLAGLLGWATDHPFLYTVLPGGATMMPNTSVALTLAGLAGLLLHAPRPGRAARIVAVISVAVALLMGLSTLLEYAFGIDVHIDQLLLASRSGPFPGRPSPLTALALVFLGLAILLFDFRPDDHIRPAEWLLMAAALVGVVGLTGLILGTGPVWRLPNTPVVGMALTTTVSLILMPIGLLLARPGFGVMAVATSDGPGGILLRRIAVPSMVMPLVLGFVTTRLFQLLDVEDYPIAVASVAVAITMAGFAVLVVTARLLNRTHEELATSRARTRELIALASDGVFLADLNGRYTEVNEAGCRMLGVTEQEIVGKTIVDLIPPDQVERLAASRAELLKGGVEVSEWRLHHKNGGYIPVEVSTRILPGGRWQAFVRDISQRKAAEEEARRSKARIDGIVSIAAEAIISIDESQRIMIFNRSAERIYGWTASEAIGQSIDILVPERFRVTHRTSVRAFGIDVKTIRQMGDSTSTMYGLRKDGTEFVAEAAISKSRVGDELTFTIVVRDVTNERRRAEQEKHLVAIGLLLASSLDRAQLCSSAANLMVGEYADLCIVDMADEKDPDYRLTHSTVAHHDPARAAAARALETLRLETRPSRFGAELFESSRPVLVARVTPEYLDAVARSPEHRQVLADLGLTSIVWVPLRARGSLLGMLTIASTDPAKQYDEADAAFCEQVGQRLALAIDNARLFEAATSAAAAREEVLRIVAHDLRNPLGTILMGASLLQQDGALTEENREKSADTIVSAANRMNRLIRDLLDVTRSEAGKLTVERAPLPAAAIVRQAVAAQQALASNASLELRVEVPDDLPDVMGDSDRILQIFENLIGNAVKFTPAGGCITVGAKRREHDVLFWVKDTGEGISPEDLQHVFDRYWQGRKTSEGAGLGSVIVKALVEAQGGHVWAESARGHGSTFYFTIPLAAEAASSPELEVLKAG